MYKTYRLRKNGKLICEGSKYKVMQRYWSYLERAKQDCKRNGWTLYETTNVKMEYFIVTTDNFISIKCQVSYVKED